MGPEQKTTDDYGFTVSGVVQITQIVLVGTDSNGDDIEIMVASNRRPIPTPYSEEP